MISNVTDTVLWCEANHRIVILDLATQRYCGLPGCLEMTFRDIATGNAVPDDQYRRLCNVLPKPLHHAGIVARLRPHADFGGPRKDLVEVSPCNGDFIETFAAVAAQAKTAVALKLKPFSQIALGLSARRKPQFEKTAMVDRYEKAIAAFLRARRILKTNDRCLMHSIAMINFLTARGFGATLVVGVKMAPWGAHAWVQDDNLILNDTVDRVAAYTPILAV